MDYLLAHLGGAHVFNSMDLVNGISHASMIHENYTPLTLVCAQSGNWGKTVMAMRLSPSSRWIQLRILCVCEDVEQVRFIIDEVLVFSKNRLWYVKIPRKVVGRTHHF